MELKLESGKVITSPTAEDMARLLPIEKFAILSDGPDSSSYLQFRKTRKRGLELEYQVDALENHFGATNTPLTLEQIIVAFQKYARGDDSWRSDVEWRRWEVMVIRGERHVVPPEWVPRLQKFTES